ncbi:S-phase kinase-associated protein 2-like [Artemia franciscana]|uniref:F-box domain-containing protein n=1 Tax=Artemia franciscana TaxID=6661 RepID=A0AA88I185_ARTSF|nr:hypothetical protein QYM36_005294 [Artemia franciscana]
MPKTKRWSIETVPVESEILADMGVVPVSDDSCDSADPAPTPPTSFPSPAEFHNNNGNDPADIENPYSLISLAMDSSEQVPGSYSGYKKRKVYSESEGGFLNLSDELMIYIFSLLPKPCLAKCLSVCKNWNRLASDESLWRKVDLSSKMLKPQHFGIALDRGVHYARCTRIHVQDPAFQFIPNSLPLIYLDLTMATISVKSLNQLLFASRRIKKLSLEHCTLNDESCQAISSMKNLETLNLAMCYGLMGVGLKTIVENCKHLEALNIAWTGLSKFSLDSLFVSLPNRLRRLNISGFRHELTNEHIESLCIKCPKLFELDISDAINITEDSIDAIAKSLPSLEYLAASRCYNIPIMAFTHLQLCKSLNHLDLFGNWNARNLELLEKMLPKVTFSMFKFSSIARPTVGLRRTSIWEVRVRS